jgi:hypothetical protein
MAEGEESGIFVSQKQTSFFGKILEKKILLFFIFGLILLGVGGYVFFQQKKSTSQTTETPAIDQNETSGSVTQLSDGATSENSTDTGATNAEYQSENFRVGDIAIGGEAQFLMNEDTPEPLVITSIRGEAFTEKSKQEVKLVVSWRTNKLAQSTVSYSKGVGQAKKSIEEEDYSLNHSVIIPGLDQASTYVYEITSNDRFGGVTTSESHAVYTGSRTVSLFDLIANAVSEVFGWAVKKN